MPRLMLDGEGAYDPTPTKPVAPTPEPPKVNLVDIAKAAGAAGEGRASDPVKPWPKRAGGGAAG